MNIRTFQLSDHLKITELLQSVMNDDCLEETMEALGRQLSWDSDLVMVAEKNDRLVGVIIGTIDNNRAYYYRVAVAAEYQRQGIGRSLIHAMKLRFLARKVNKILVTADAHNEPVIPFYQALGFGQHDFLPTSDKLSIVMG